MLLLYRKARNRFGSHHVLSKPHFKDCYGCSVFSIQFERGNSPVTKKPNHPQGIIQAGAVFQRYLNREEWRWAKSWMAETPALVWKLPGDSEEIPWEREHEPKWRMNQEKLSWSTFGGNWELGFAFQTVPTSPNMLGLHQKFPCVTCYCFPACGSSPSWWFIALCQHIFLTLYSSVAFLVFHSFFSGLGGYLLALVSIRASSTGLCFHC